MASIGIAGSYGNAKECSNCHTIALISHASKVMLKILQARLQQYTNCELPDVQAEFRKGRGTKGQIASICWIMEKAREFQKNIYFCFIEYVKAFAYLEPVCCSMSSSHCCFLTCVQISQEAGQVVWYSHLLNFPQFIVIHTVEGFGIVNKAEVDVFLELSSFSMIQRMLAI